MKDLHGYGPWAGCTESEIGLLVTRAAFAPIGRFLDRDEADLVRAVELNGVTLVRLARRFSRR